MESNSITVNLDNLDTITVMDWCNQLFGEEAWTWEAYTFPSLYARFQLPDPKAVTLFRLKWLQ